MWTNLTIIFDVRTMLLVVLGYTKAATPLPSARANFPSVFGPVDGCLPNMCFLLGKSAGTQVWVFASRTSNLRQGAAFDLGMLVHPWFDPGGMVICCFQVPLGQANKHCERSGQFLFRSGNAQESPCQNLCHARTAHHNPLAGIGSFPSTTA